MPNDEIKISLTTFVDFVSKSGTARLTAVKQAKEQYNRPYSPGRDFWRQLRTAIIDMHRDGQSKQVLDDVIRDLTDQKKKNRYMQCISAYKQWMGRKTFEWANYGTQSWQHERLVVNVNPELGLKINGDEHTIKLYFKAEQLSKNRQDSILHLLRQGLSKTKRSTVAAGVLDICQSRLITQTMEIPGIEALLRGEASAFVAMWDQLEP